MNRGSQRAGRCRARYYLVLLRASIVTCSIIVQPFLQLPALGQQVDLQFEHITTDNGLTQDIVNDIYRDKFGFLWIGTEDGINRYDGYSVRTYKNNPEDSTSLTGRIIYGMCDFGENDLLVATERGLNIYDRAKDIFTRPQGAIASLAGSHCGKPVADLHGNIWIIVESRKLLRYNALDDHLTTIELHLRPGTPLVSVFPGRSDSLWIAADSSVVLFQGDAQEIQTFQLRSPMNNDIVGPICFEEDERGDLWVGSGAGLYQIQRESRKSTFIPLNINNADSQPDHELIAALQMDKRHRLWIGGFNGLYCFDPQRRLSVRYPHDVNDRSSLLGNRVYDIYIDPSELLWVGTWRGGLNKADLKKERFGYVRNSPATPFAGGIYDISGMCEDVFGNLWLGATGSNITCIKATTHEYAHFDFTERFRKNRETGDLAAIVADSTGVLWIATNSALTKYDPVSGARSRIDILPHGHQRGSILAAFMDRSGFLWIGTDIHGVIRYDRKNSRITQFGPGSADPTYHKIGGAWSFYEDGQGNLWIGGWGGSTNLYCLDAKRVGLVCYPQLQLQTVRGIEEDESHNIWVGTWGAGLSRFTPATGEILQFTERNGLANNFVKSILSDDKKNLWIATEHGLSKFSMSNETFRNFDMRDGIQGNLFYSGSCSKGRDGKLYFGGEHGFNAFYPDSIVDELFNPPVVISAFRVFDQPRLLMHASASVPGAELSHEENLFSFDFVALDYTTPERTQYSYRLEGFSAGWSAAGTRRYATYTHLDPGEYTFTVKGTNGDGIWSDKTAQVRVRVLPAIWQTWWFRVAAILVTVGIPLVIYRYRAQKLLEVERTRNRIARDLHDEVSATLSGITYFTEAIKGEISNLETPQAAKYLSLIQKSSNDAQESMSDIIWSVNPEYDQWEQVVAKFRRYASDVFDSKAIRYTIDIPDEWSTRSLTMDERRNIWLIYKEIVTNIVKHSSCKEVQIELSPTRNGFIVLRCVDDGVGFEEGNHHKGNGLRNIRARADAMRASVLLASSGESGTSWEIRFPLS